MDGVDEDVTLSYLMRSSLSGSEAALASSEYNRVPDLLAQLSTVKSLIDRLAILSSNESINELSTPSIPALLVDYEIARLSLQTRTPDYAARIAVLSDAKDLFEAFGRRLREYGIVGRDWEKKLGVGVGNSDPAAARMNKIAQYKEEKALHSRIQALSATTGNNDDGDDDDDDRLRELYLAQLSHAYIRSIHELASIEQELELLKNAPNMSELPSRHSNTDSRSAQRTADSDTTWRLDSAPSTSRPTSTKQLIDSSGRVLRPFTILPSASSSSLDTRLAFQRSVFGSSHNLPTMTIDEYLDQEMERGNILQGGGAKNSEESRKEAADRRAWEREEDNEQGYKRDEEQRLKEVKDDEWKDWHKRGEGNRMNQG